MEIIYDGITGSVANEYIFAYMSVQVFVGVVLCSKRLGGVFPSSLGIPIGFCGIVQGSFSAFG